MVATPIVEKNMKDITVERLKEIGAFVEEEPKGSKKEKADKES